MEVHLSDGEEITYIRLSNTWQQKPGEGRSSATIPVSFNRKELFQILNVYGRFVASGEWRDYAIDQLSDRAEFSIYRRTNELALYRIIKNPKLACKQGAFSIVTQTGLILKRGRELAQVLRILEKKSIALVSG